MAGLIPEAIIDDIRNRADIVEIIGSHVALKRRGSDFWGLCPFHREKTPSFKVSATHQAFHCFGCTKSGNVFTFVMEMENVDFVGAIHLLARRVGVRIPETDRTSSAGGTPHEDAERRGQLRDRLYRLSEQIGEWYSQNLSQPEAEGVRRYLQDRKLTPDVVADFKLGYSPDSWDAAMEWGACNGYDQELMITAGLLSVTDDAENRRCYDRFRGRLMFPIWDDVGRVVGFSARSLDPDAKGAKYVNTPATAIFQKGRLLYGLHRARQAFRERGTALLCEGQLDVIACHRAGLTHAVAPQGTAFTEEHARLLKRFTESVTFAFDADSAGEKAALRSIGIANAAGLRSEVIAMPSGEDPDSLYRSSGAEGLQSVMGDPLTSLSFGLELAKKHHSVDTPGGKADAAKEAIAMLSSLSDPVSRATSCQWISRQLGLPEGAVFDELNRVLRAQRRRGVGRGHDADRQAAEAPSAPVVMPSKVERAQLTLLDLASHHGFIAHELVHELSHDAVSDTVVGRALNLVVALTEQGEWSRAGRELAEDQALATDPSVARVLVESEFAGIDPGHAEDHKRRDQEELLQKGMRDCLRQLELAIIERRSERLLEALRTEGDPQKLEELQREICDLVRRRHELAVH